MPETTPPAAKPEPTITALALSLNLARAALIWERIWPGLGPAFAVLGAFLAVALLDLPALVPGWVDALALLATIGVSAWIVGRIFRGFTLPDEAAARRRLETASGLAHRPLTAISDRRAGDPDDEIAAALWQAHRERAAHAIGKLTIGVPAGGFLTRDPYGVRVVLAILLLLGLIDAGRDSGDRLWRALIPDLSYMPGPAQPASLDLWVTPPAYTGLPPRFLPSANPKDGNGPIQIPTGSSVLAQVHGGRAAPHFEIDGKTTDFSAIDAKNYKGAATLTEGHNLAVVQNSRTLGAWPIAILPDQPPHVEFDGTPQGTSHAALRIAYHASDDYGVETVKAVIHLAGGPTDETLALDLPLPDLHAKDSRNASYEDLTANPWSGLPVEIHLEAADALGQLGKSETLTVTLPERHFHHPVARALIDERRELTLHPENRDAVGETVSDLSLRPALYADDQVAFLAMRVAAARLALDPSASAIPPIQQLLWDTAVRIENGHTDAAQRDVRDSMQALQNALANNASDAEIDRLTQELRQAMDRYLKAMAENMQRQGIDPKDLPPVDPSHALSEDDLQKLLQRALDLAHTGAKDAARDALAQLQNLLENLRLGRGPLMPGAGQAMRDMEDLMQRQQQLLDRSFRASRDGKPGAGKADAAEQDALRRRLDQILGQPGQSGGVPQALSRAERAMEGAAEALKRGAPGDAIEPQSDAIDQLQQAARDLMDKMGSASGGSEEDNTGRDPFGRLVPGGSDADGELRTGRPGADSFGIERAKQILEELRRRSGDPNRPEIERDYINRLLKRF